MRHLKAIAWLFFISSLLSFSLGLILERHYLCGQPGPWAFLASLTLCALSSFTFFAMAWRKRSWGIALGALAVAGLVFVLLSLSIAATLPGCSGV